MAVTGNNSANLSVILRGYPHIRGVAWGCVVVTIVSFFNVRTCQRPQVAHTTSWIASGDTCRPL